MEKHFEELKNFISDLFSNKVENVAEVKVLDNEEVTEKMNSLEEMINNSNKENTELSAALEEKESNIVALVDEVKMLEEKLAKMDATPTAVVPESDPNPVVGETKVDAWSNLADVFKK